MLAAALCVPAVLSPSLVHAQTGSITGRVVEEASTRPLANVQVMIAGTNQATLTDSRGAYLLTNVRAGTHEVRVVSIGYRAASQSVTVAAGGTARADFRLATSAIALDEIVVTGVAGGSERRAVPNVVSRIDANQVVETEPVRNVQDLLNGRVAGVVVMPASGGVGTGSRIRIRGATSLTLANEPLIYVDGVRIDNRATSGPASQGFGSSVISRWNDINPDEIESIEIIKGPAAATLYGTEAANGVIQIITKRGAAGDARWSATIRQGINYLANQDEIFATNYQIVPAANRQAAIEAGGRLVDEERGIVALDIVALERQRGTPIFRTGQLRQYDLSVSGGSDLVRYFASGGIETNEGAERSNDLERYSTRLNLTLAPNRRIDLGASVGYVEGNTRVSAEGGWGGRVWSVVLADPRNLTNPMRRGFHSGVPEAYDLMYNFSQGISRFTASLQANHRPTSWLSQRLAIGTDVTRADDVIFVPRVDSMIPNPVWGSEALGSRSVTANNVRVGTFDYSASANFDLVPGLTSSTSVGAQYYTNFREWVFARGSVFPAEGLTSISATTVNRQNDQDQVEDRTLGLFVQEQLGWQDRLFLTAGVRMDDNSAFGENFTRVYYPKFGASWVVSEEPFWRLAGFNSLRLRAAYGESGLQPQTFAALRTYDPVTGPNDAPAVTPQFIGNPNLGPERSREVELGFDAGILDDRLGLEFTYYNQHTDDAILTRALAPSVGFSGTQFFNAGEIRNYGLEMLVRARPVERRNVGLEVSLNLANHESEVLRLGEGEEWVGAGTYLRHQIGHPVGAWFSRRVVSAEFGPDGRTAINVMCDDGEGGAVPCAGAPDVYLGRTVPNWEGGLSSTLTLFNQVRISGMLDFKHGYRKLDGNTRIRTLFFGGRAREVFFPEEIDPRRAAAIQGRGLVDFLIDDASFTKLREVSVAYTAPTSVAERIGGSRLVVSLAGRNLATWTSFGGLDPEAFFLGGSRGGGHSVWDQTMLPQLRQWVATVNLNF